MTETKTNKDKYLNCGIYQLKCPECNKYTGQTERLFQRYTEIYIYSTQSVPGGNVPDFGRMFLKLKYTNITKNTYIQS